VIRVERPDPAVAWIPIDRPEARNAMTFAMWERLLEIAGELELLLRGAAYRELDDEPVARERLDPTGRGGSDGSRG